MIYEEKTPDPEVMGSGEAPDEGVEEIPMEDITAFMQQIREDEQNPPSSDELGAMFNTAKDIIDAAIQMNNEGPEGNTPLAKLLSNEVVAAALIAVMMAPQFSDFEKVQMLGALVLVSCKEYKIEL